MEEEEAVLGKNQPPKGEIWVERKKKRADRYEGSSDA